jgi:hypothetical protein
VILKEKPPIAVDSREGSRAEITSYTLNSFSIRAHVEKACIMVLGEIDYPDWVTRVDGKVTGTLTANHCLRALPLEPGDHEIVCEYTSPVIRRSLAVSIVSMAVSLAVAILAGIVLRKRE